MKKKIKEKERKRKRREKKNFFNFGIKLLILEEFKDFGVKKSYPKVFCLI